MAKPRAVELSGRAYTRGGRAAAALLLGVAAASLPAMLVLVLLATDPPVTPSILWRLLLPFTVLPGLAGLLVRRAYTARIEVRDALLRISRPGAGIEIPCDAIAGVAPWRLPAPGPGLSLALRSGRSVGLELADPAALLAALDGAGAKGAREAAARPLVVYAAARPVRPRRPLLRLLARYPVFALAPGAVLFNLHQHIAYGGTFGEWYTLGAASYLQTAAVYWATTTAYLAMYASVWRGAAEGLCLATACVVPARAAAVRRIAEAAFRALYYGGVPALLALRLLA